ncbi:ABC transporter ATP-binding protein [Patescibacteria group bacterium]|nr:ABC transporter ATP-binding protein [Patescibacteria group bacterium]MBU3999903.1 ABC transporter ATP-binding protein [Patescibacteria group bacterium]MBU4056966.1 ABC transporter ATP-binding protein [Patescibacteria group bacterium]MBU4368701.1 ABC transporter ATP-binding protein [Patescibacteria group bacterium]
MPQSSQPIIKTENLSVVYNKGTTNEFWALRDINIAIYPKEYIIFFGPSGCGKSTLLNGISGLETNISGKVIVGGKELSGLSEDEISDFHRSGVGMIFQQYNLISSLSVLDNIALPQIFLGVGKKERTQKVKILLERFGILEQAQKIPTELSGGQQQRIGVARSLVNDPKILLADEPIGNLDSVSAVNVMDILRKLNVEEGKTLILVTHNPEYLFYANRIFYMKDGEIVREVVNKELRPKEVVKEEAVEKKESTEEKLSKEFQVLLRSFPGLSPMQLNMLLIPFKSKMLVNYVLSPYEVDEISRMEQIVSDRLNGRTDRDEMKTKLDRDYSKGGAGLNSRTAERIANIIEDFLNKTKLVNEKKITRESGGKIKENYPDFSSIWSQITELRRGFIDPMHKILSDRQIMRLESAIYSRLTGDLNKDAFNEALDRSFSKGGVGFNKATAKKITNDMEMILLLVYGAK